MIIYLIQSAVCMSFLLGIYKLLYEKKKMHRFNRFYLLFSLVGSLVLPLVDFSIIEVKEVVPPKSLAVEFPFLFWETDHPSNQPNTPNEVIDSLLSSEIYLWGFYLIGASIFALRFFRNLNHIYRMGRKYKHARYKNAHLILVPETILPFSFASMIFVAQCDHDKGLLAPEIFMHELAHVRQGHSLDLILVELLSIIFWFNPLLKWYRRAIQTNHEFLADEAVNQQFKNIPVYQTLLVDKCGLRLNFLLNNHLNYSITKLRLIMMYKQTSPIKATVKKLVLLPVLLLLAIVFGSQSVAQDEKNTEEKPSDSAQHAPATDPVKAYLTLIDHARMENNKSIDARKLDKKQLRAYYSQMTEEQKKAVPWVPFLELRLPEKKSPTAEQFSTWMDPETFGVWLNDTRISNEELKEYQAEDIALYYQSRLEKNARNYGRHVYQLNIYTQEGYDKVIDRLKDSFNDN